MWGRVSIDKMAKTKKAQWSGFSDGYKESLLTRSFHSPEAKKASLASRLLFWPSLTEEERVLRIRRCTEGLESFYSSEFSIVTRNRLSEAGKAAWASKTPKEKEEWLRKSLHSSEARNKSKSSSSLSNKKYWASLPQEEYEDRIQGLKIG